MSIITAIDDLETLNWSVKTENLMPRSAELRIGFTKQAPVIEFQNLKFGYVFSKNGVVIQQANFPPEGVRYIRSDQTFLVNEVIKYDPDQTYSLFMWCENAGNRFEDTFEIITPRPRQPGASWDWNGSEWVPPTPMPDDGKPYAWNEETQSWDLVAE